MWRTVYTVLMVGSLALTVFAAEPTPKSNDSPATDDAAELYDLGKQLFDQYAPPEVKAQWEFPSRDGWDKFAERLQLTLESGSFESLASEAPEARAALLGLKTIPGYEDYTEWLQERVDYMEAAGEIAPPASPHSIPKRSPTSLPPSTVPYYGLWLARVGQRPIPTQALDLIPQLRTVFAEEGVPPELVWLAEAESSLNPSARSPAGAKGLFQLMPDTAKSLGLSTSLPDERINPRKSARAAARYLRTLHARFGNWPLVFAAYNAGEGRVSRALQARSAIDFAGVASSLPTETRMYVPKVLALVETRAGVTPDKIPPPRG